MSKKLNHWVGWPRTTASRTATQARAAASSPSRASVHEGTQRERGGVAEERDRRVAPGAERAVPLDGDDLAAAERGDQLQRDGGVVARDEADAMAVPAHPALDVSDLFWGDHDVRRPVGVTGQEPAGELPVPDVRGERDHAPGHSGEILRPRRRADEGPEPGF